MTRISAQKFDWPISGTGLDFVKIMAAILMVIDHIDLLWFDRQQILFFLLGRGAYPLFAYACACAFLRAGTDKAHLYAKRLIIWGLITIPISMVCRDVDAANILFTLAIGAGITPFLIHIHIYIRVMIFGAALFSMQCPNIFEYGFLGALLPAAIYSMMIGQKDGVYMVFISY